MQVPSIATVQRMKWLKDHLATMQDELREIKFYLKTPEAEIKTDAAIGAIEITRAHLVNAMICEISRYRENEKENKNA